MAQSPASSILFYGDNLQFLQDSIRDETVGLIYLDHPQLQLLQQPAIYGGIGLGLLVFFIAAVLLVAATMHANIADSKWVSLSLDISEELEKWMKIDE